VLKKYNLKTKKNKKRKAKEKSFLLISFTKTIIFLYDCIFVVKKEI